MTSHHHEEKIPWHCLTDHVDFDRSIGFKVRFGSRLDSRKEAFAHFTRELASVIVEAAEAQLSLIPKPKASRPLWRNVGVPDDALFPVEFRQYWQDANSDYDAQFVLAVLTKPANPFRHLTPLIYLARNPKGTMGKLLGSYTAGQHDTEPGLRSFAFFTMSYYLLLNLILALDSGASFDEGTTRASRFHSRFQNSRPLVPDNEDPHTAFWYSAPPECQSPDLRAAYSLRCFRLLVALYAVMKEAALRDVAVEADPYRSYGGDVSTFAEDMLVEVICRALNSISPAFSDFERSLVGDLPVTLARDAPASHQPEDMPQRRSLFVWLPAELHHYIASFLSVDLQSLVNLAATCQRLHAICTPLIFAEPFPDEEEDPKARSSALTGVLSSKKELASHIRRLRVRVDGTPAEDRLNVYLYPPLQKCLTYPIMRLVELHLYVPYACQDCQAKLEDNDSLVVACHFRVMDAIAAVTRRWPNLSSLSLVILDTKLSHLNEATTIPSPMPVASIPHHLQKLTITDDYEWSIPLVPWATQKALMHASSRTLRYLVLHLERTTIHGLPVFPNLERLELSTYLPIKDIRPLLQKSFASVRFLSLANKNLQDEEGLTLNLSSILDGLEHLSVSAGSLSRLILPPSVVTVRTYYYDIPYPSVSVTGSPHLTALCFGGNDTVVDVFPDLSEEHSSHFQMVRSLERQIDTQPEDLPQLGEIIAARLPNLEVLILFVRAFSDHPRREDYPMDDGLDDVQKAAAVSLFESCPGLNTISFNGIPDVWDRIGRFPARVWMRDSGDSGGARMTGRAALPWKLDEMWDST